MDICRMFPIFNFITHYFRLVIKRKKTTSISRKYCFFLFLYILILGFGAPVPRTTAGRVSAVVFAAVGIPLHLILILNVGQLSACLLLSLAARGQRHGLRMPVALIQCCCSRYFSKIIIFYKLIRFFYTTIFLN